MTSTTTIAKHHVAMPRVDTSVSRLPTQDVVNALANRLSVRAASDPTYWSFIGNDRRGNGHKLFSYPAMMVPQLQGALLDDLLEVDPTIGLVYDPFAGSGTVLVESMLRGLDFIGSDINPLAVLIMSAKSNPLSERHLRLALDRIMTHFNADTSGVDVEFRGRDKWFHEQVSIGLSRLRRAIVSASGVHTRRFFWVCLAETVRLVSNSRTSTFKLHAYAPDILANRLPDVATTFEEIALGNIAQVQEQLQALSDAGHLERNKYLKTVHCLLADVRDAKAWPSGRLADVLMTSPPYGDNRTTVPYGQHAFLPLSWIDRRDISRDPIIEQLMGSPYRTDVASLGGRNPRLGNESRTLLMGRSSHLEKTAIQLKKTPGDGYDRLITFCYDLDSAIVAMLSRVRAGAMMFWTLGERRISGLQIPTTRIVAELCASRGAREVTVLHRDIPNNAKRMALRNDTVPTMRTEAVLIMQSPADAQPSVQLADHGQGVDQNARR